jgi:hypothetical protein
MINRLKNLFRREKSTGEKLQEATYYLGFFTSLIVAISALSDLYRQLSEGESQDEEGH